MDEPTLEAETPLNVPICKRAGCGKAAWPGRAYCSRERAPQGGLGVEERECENHCGKRFRVMPTSSQRFCSSLCQSLKEGADPFKGQDWRTTGAVKKPPSHPNDQEEEADMPKGAKQALTAAELARALGVENYKVYHAIKTGRIKRGAEGFDVAEAKLALGAPPRERRAPRGNGQDHGAQATVTPIRPELTAVPPAPTQAPALAEIRRKAFDAALAKFRAVLLEESDRLEQTGDLRTQNQLLKDCIRAETRFQRCFDPEAA